MNMETVNRDSVDDQPLSTSWSNYNIPPIHARNTAIAAGDLRAAVLQEVTNILAANRGNPLKATKSGLERLKANRLISTADQQALDEICDVLFALQRAKAERNEVISKTRSIYKMLLADENSSPVALAIASMSAGDSRADVSGDQELTSDERTALAARAAFNADLGMVGGTIGGAVIGGTIGGVGGAIIGAIVGGIAGGIAGACSDD